MGHLAIAALGQLRLEFEGRPLPRTVFEKARALLVYLAVDPRRAHPRESLALLLWPDLPRESARTNLRKALQVLRRAFDGDDAAPLAISREDVRFSHHSDHALDLSAFASTRPDCRQRPGSPECPACIEELQSAIGLYRGPFLEGVHIESEPFDEWLAERRDYYHRHMLGLLQRLSGCCEQEGQLAEAVAAAERYVALEPWDEAGRRRLMRLLALSGQPGAAIAQFRAYADLLARELDGEPERETRALFEAIQRGEIAAEATRDGEPPPRKRRERRRLTAIACEIVEKVPLDPEELAALTGRKEEQFERLISEAGGQVVRFHGGRLAGYFGLPTAREDAVFQALRTALSLSGEEPNSPLACRLGVHTGETVQDEESPVPDPLGSASRFAFEITRVAPDNSVVVSDSVRRLAGGYFRFEPAGSVHAAGTPHAIWRAESRTGAEDRLAAAASPLSPMIGRDGELVRLESLWRTATAGSGSAAIVRGEPGVGKTRLIRTFLERQHGAQIIEGRCFQHLQGTTLYPFTEAVRQLLGVRQGDTRQAQRACLESGVQALGADPGTAVPLLALLLGLHEGDGRAPMPPSPERRTRTQSLLLRLFTAAAAKPVLLVVEDLHWADPTSLDLMAMLAAAAPDLPLLLLSTCRPEFKPVWQSAVFETDPLPPAATRQLVEAIAGEAVPEPLIERIVENTAGVPLFVEEMVHACLEDPAGRTADDVPGTLHDLIAARLDQLGPAKHLAQLGSALGREFPAKLLAAVAGIDGEALRRQTTPLLRNGLWRVRPLPGGDRLFAFKHALVQESAYNTMVKSDRVAVHRHIAQVLRTSFADSAEANPQQMARHLTAAGEIAKALDAWELAGQQSSPPEAIGHYRTALRLLRQFPRDEKRWRRELTLQRQLGRALVDTQGYGSQEAGAAFDRAWHLGQRLDLNQEQTFEMLWGLWLVSSSRGGFNWSITLGKRLLELAEHHPEREMATIRARYALGNPLLFLGEFDAAHDHLNIGVDVHRALGAPVAPDSLLTEHPGIASLSFMAWNQWFRGLPDTAAETAAESVRQARTLDHPRTLCFTLIFAAQLHRLRNEPEAVRHYAVQAQELAEESGLVLWQLTAGLMLGWCQVQADDDAGTALLAGALAGIRQAMPSVEILALLPLAESHLRFGRRSAFEQCLEEAFAAVDRWGDRSLLPELHRLKAEAMAQGGEPERAGDELDLALRLAASLSPTLELRAALSYCRLHSDHDRHPRAVNRLAEAMNRFTEGFETVDYLAAARICAAALP